MLDVLFTVGDNGVSIGTEQFLEDEKSIDMLNDTDFLINIRTLIRNAINCFNDKENLRTVLVHIRDRIDADITAIKLRLGFTTNVIVYASNYEALAKDTILIPNVIPKTKKQLLQHDLEEQSFKLCKELINHTFNKVLTNTGLSNDRTVFVMTHYPVDLLGANTFRDLALVESHTGLIKTRLEFNTKLNIKKEYREYIPFTELTLKLFGDKTLYAGHNRVTRNKIFEIAQKYSWTPNTTQSRLLFCIGRESKELVTICNDIIRHL